MSDTSSPPPSPAVPADKTDKKRKSKNDDVPELEVDLELPEPPSKRAKRALKKGKVLPSKANKPKFDDDVADAADDKDKKAGSKKDKEERSQFGIWIGNLAFTITRPQLFQWFVDSSGGAIAASDITRINLPLGKRLPNAHFRPHNTHAESQDKAAGATAAPNKGFAYVDFVSLEAKTAATALSETELEGRRVLIKDSKSFEGRPAANSGAPGNPADKTAASRADDDKEVTAPTGMTSTKVFVGNLGFDTSEEDLRRHFAPCGPVAWVKVATFPDNTEKCRGYGWVQFGGKTDDGGNVTPEVAATAAAAAVKGFVRVEEAVDTEEDFIAEAEGGDDADNSAETGAEPATKNGGKERKTKSRKWWVNMLKGRPLKVQFAEDDQQRYKKRFTKGRQPDKEGGSGGSGAGEGRPPRKEFKPRYKKETDMSVASRTGGIVESTGVKVTFD